MSTLAKVALSTALVVGFGAIALVVAFVRALWEEMFK